MRPLIAVALEGLSENQKELPAVLLHDAQGAALYERICAQPEYYLARAETRLLERHGAAIGALVGPQAALVEYGAGSARKTRMLLNALPDPHAYVAIDADPGQLEQTAVPSSDVFALCASCRAAAFGGDARHHRQGEAARRLFFGLDEGNFRALEAVALLNSIRETLGPRCALLVGVDLRKNPAVLGACLQRCSWGHGTVQPECARAIEIANSAPISSPTPSVIAPGGTRRMNAS